MCAIIFGDGSLLVWCDYKVQVVKAKEQFRKSQSGLSSKTGGMELEELQASDF